MAPLTEFVEERAAVLSLDINDMTEFIREVKSYADETITENALMISSDKGSPHSYFEITTTSTDAPVRDPLTIVIPVTAIYLTILITGILGNVLTCLIISRNKSMHTATNFYLFSLSISDLVLLITGLPQEMYTIWSRYPYIFGEVFCIIRGLAAETSANATVLTITAFTVERYMAICHPFYSHTLSKLSRAIRLIVIIWILALVFAIPTAAQVGIIGKEKKHTICAIKHYKYAHYFCVLSVIFFLVPLNIIIVLYVLIGLRLRQSNRMERVTGQPEQGTLSDGTGSTSDGQSGRHRRGTRHSNQRSTRGVVKMLVVVVIAFFLCWAPFHAQRLVAIYGSNSDNSPKYPHMLKLYEIITYISGILYYTSTTINPILYNIMSHKFREAFKETVWACCRRCQTADRQTYNNLPRKMERPLKVDETDFLSRSPPDLNRRGTLQTKKEERLLSKVIEDKELIADVGSFALRSSIHESQTNEKGSSKDEIPPLPFDVSKTSTSTLVEQIRFFTMHKSWVESETKQEDSERDGENMVVMLAVAATVVATAPETSSADTQLMDEWNSGKKSSEEEILCSKAAQNRLLDE